MKKILAFAMAAVLMLGLAACGGSGASAPASSAAGSASASSGASGQDSAGGTSVVEEIQEKGVLTMMTATGFPPFEYLGEDLWHLSHEGLDLEDPANEPDYAKPGFLELGVAPEQAPDTPAYITIHFEKGKPTALDGKAMKASTLLKELNAVGGANGIGIIDIVENRLVGMKSRGVYETPGGTILYFAHEQLEMLCLDKETAHYKALVAQKFADIVYNGQWYTPLREALSAFVDKTQENVTGDVKLKLYKGNIIPAGTTSPYSLYSEDLATFGEDSVYDQADSAGFIHLFGLPITVQAKLKEKLAAEKE